MLVYPRNLDLSDFCCTLLLTHSFPTLTLVYSFSLSFVEPIHKSFEATSQLTSFVYDHTILMSSLQVFQYGPQFCFWSLYYAQYLVWLADGTFPEIHLFSSVPILSMTVFVPCYFFLLHNRLFSCVIACPILQHILLLLPPAFDTFTPRYL